MEHNKLLQAIGISYKAHKLIKGEALLKAISQQKINLVLLANDMGASQKKKFQDKCHFYKIQYDDQLLNRAQLAQACGLKTLVAIGFSDQNIIKLIQANLSKGE